ncbi:efflux RND transporter periplasmic adaptor subunit [Niveibacterium sp. SC-1]|uniref:efflux RND transporter periplasmic adaptor subunit n=1 Tax=Niveibacterium sp. SC-1 TaxID=3135646 RepID=UPI00311F4850
MLGLSTALISGPLLAAQATAPQRYDCIVQPSEMAEVGSSVIGVVERVRVGRGDEVRRGDQLVQLVAGSEQAAVRLAEVKAASEADLRASKLNMDLAERKLRRNEALVAQKFVADQARDTAEAELAIARQKYEQARDQQKVAREELAYAQAQLRNRSVSSPVDGVVLDVRVRAGERVEERPLLRIGRLDVLDVSVLLPGTLFGGVRRDQVAKVLPLGAREAVPATVYRVDPVLDTPSGMFAVTLRLPNPERSLVPGGRCQLSFEDLPGNESALKPGSAALRTARGN